MISTLRTGKVSSDAMGAVRGNGQEEAKRGTTGGSKCKTDNEVRGLLQGAA